jgi:hypothetical protein
LAQDAIGGTVIYRGFGQAHDPDLEVWSNWVKN